MSRELSLLETLYLLGTKFGIIFGPKDDVALANCFSEYSG